MTDAGGHCIVAGPRGGGGVYLRARSADRAPHIEAVALAADAQRLTIRLARPVRLRGRVEPMAALAMMFADMGDQLMVAGRMNALQNTSPWVMVRDASGGLLARAPLAADGSFDIEGLQPNRVGIAISGRVSRPGYTGVGCVRVAEADLAPDMAPLVLDARRAILHEIRGRARVAQGPLGDAYLRFESQERVDENWFGFTPTGPDGTFVTWLPEGKHVVRLQSQVTATGELVVRGPMTAVDLVLSR